MISRIVSHFPERVVTNDELALEFSDWPAERILAKTGIAQRHMAGPKDFYRASRLTLSIARRRFSSQLLLPPPLISAQLSLSMQSNLKEQVIEVICEALREQNLSGANAELASPSSETRLLGEKSALDSIGLVSLIVDLEEKIADKFGRSVVLADERAMSLRQSPFRRVDSLADHIVQKLEEQA